MPPISAYWSKSQKHNLSKVVTCLKPTKILVVGLRFRERPGSLKCKTKNSNDFLSTKLSTNNVSWNVSKSCKLMYLRNLFCQIFDFIVRIFQIVELNLAFLFMDVFACICQFFWIKKNNRFYQHVDLHGLTFTVFSTTWQLQ